MWIGLALFREQSLGPSRELLLAASVHGKVIYPREDRRGLNETVSQHFAKILNVFVPPGDKFAYE